MDLLRQAAHLNSEGVFWISLGNHARAKISLMSSFQIMCDLKQNSFQQLSGQVSGQYSSPCIALNSLNGTNFKDEQFHIFNQTIEFIIGPTHAASCHDEDCVSFYTAVILFNMALAHHIEARETHDTNKLYKSAQFYNMIMNTLDENAVDSEWSQHLMMAALNNLAHIHFVLGRVEEAREEMELLKMMSYTFNMFDDSSSVVKEYDLNQFLLNTIVTDPPSAAPCA